MIAFGQLNTLSIGAGIDDKSWQQNDPETAEMDQQSGLQGLFEMETPAGEQK